MEDRPLGRTGVQVRKLCLGTMRFGAWGNRDHANSIRIIHAALDAGVNFVDSADVYSEGESEEIVGKALQGRRDDVVLATKFFHADGRGPAPARRLAALIVTAVEDSLRGETRYPEAGSGHLDGPEYSPDGAWLYVNTVEFATRPGHAQLARRTAGASSGWSSRTPSNGSRTCLPNAEYATYVSFPPGTLSHPADLDVEVRLVRTSSRRDSIAR